MFQKLIETRNTGAFKFYDNIHALAQCDRCKFNAHSIYFTLMLN